MPQILCAQLPALENLFIARNPRVNRLRQRMAELLFVFFQAEDGIRDTSVTGVQTCALPIWEAIRVPDNAFAHLFNFFKDYDWHLDDREARAGNEINPDVLGYIFEKYINQKEMGAYYTKEDITEY